MSAFDPKPYLMDLKGKKYLQVAYRILWLNEDAKAQGYSFRLHTELVQEKEWKNARGVDVKEAVFKAIVEIYKDDRLLKSVVGWGSETSTDFGDYREKAETKAIGRALALAGFGTQFAVADFDEGEGISPVDGSHGPAVVDAPIRPVNGDERKELLSWLQAKANNPNAVKLIKGFLEEHKAQRVSDLPTEVLREIRAKLS